MAITSKPASQLDASQVLQQAFNDNDSTLSINGFVTSKVGHKMFRDIVSSTVDDWYFFDIFSTQTLTVTSASAVIGGIASTDNLVVGQYVFGTNIPDKTTIASIDSSTQITLSAVATGSASESVEFANLLIRLRITYSDGAHTDVNAAQRLN